MQLEELQILEASIDERSVVVDSFVGKKKASRVPGIGPSPADETDLCLSVKFGPSWGEKYRPI